MRISDWSSDVCSSDLHVLNDRPAELPADLEILRLDLARTAAEFFERRRGAHALVGIVDEGFTVKFVGARARNGGDGDRTHLVELGLVVRRDDAILADRELRKRVALRRILSKSVGLRVWKGGVSTCRSRG